MTSASRVRSGAAPAVGDGSSLVSVMRHSLSVFLIDWRRGAGPGHADGRKGPPRPRGRSAAPATSAAVVRHGAGDDIQYAMLRMQQRNIESAMPTRGKAPPAVRRGEA